MAEQKMNMNLMKLVAQFSTEERCRQYLEDVRWPEGAQCPRCAAESVSHISTRDQYDCNKCRYRFSVTSGTIFHDSHLPLAKWLIAIYLMIEAKKGISANQLKRTIDVSYKTAWYLCHRIRKAMTGAYPFPLKGIVQIDETYVGKSDGRGRTAGPNKACVVGAIQQDGKIILKVVKNAGKKELANFIQESVSEEADAIYTDEWKPYMGAGGLDVSHKTVQHAVEYVTIDGVTTNSIENVWSLFKRAIMGTYHKLSPKHLQAYLEELEWRFNNRENPWLFRDTVQRLMVSGNLEYKKLVA